MSKKTTTLILELKKIQRIINSSPVLDIRHLKFHKGTIYGVVGPVGSGKSSLLSILSGSVKPHKGIILYDYEPFKKNFFGKTQIPSDMTFINNNKADNSTVKSLFRKSNASQVLLNYFSNLSVDKILNTSMKKLSMGEKSAVELSHGIESDPRVLIIDNYALYYDNKMENQMILQLHLTMFFLVLSL